MTRGRPGNDAVYGRKGDGVKGAPLHAPCPRCYSDCTPPVFLNAELVATFECDCGEAFTTKASKARSHTTWLLTRGSSRVQAALATEAT